MAEGRVRGFSIATRCETVDDFIAKFAGWATGASIFVPTPDSRNVGVECAFAILLANKKPVLAGTCLVLEVFADGKNEYRRPGMRLGIKRLGPESEPVFAQLRAAAPKLAPKKTRIGMPAVAAPVAAQPVAAPPPVMPERVQIEPRRSRKPSTNEPLEATTAVVSPAVTAVLPVEPAVAVPRVMTQPMRAQSPPLAATVNAATPIVTQPMPALAKRPYRASSPTPVTVVRAATEAMPPVARSPRPSSEPKKRAVTIPPRDMPRTPPQSTPPIVGPDRQTTKKNPEPQREAQREIAKPVGAPVHVAAEGSAEMGASTWVDPNAERTEPWDAPREPSRPRNEPRSEAVTEPPPMRAPSPDLRPSEPAIEKRSEPAIEKRSEPAIATRIEPSTELRSEPVTVTGIETAIERPSKPAIETVTGIETAIERPSKTAVETDRPSKPAVESRAPGSAYVLPANPLMNMTDASLEGMVDCRLFESSSVTGLEEPTMDSPPPHEDKPDVLPRSRTRRAHSEPSLLTGVPEPIDATAPALVLPDAPLPERPELSEPAILPPRATHPRRASANAAQAIPVFSVAPAPVEASKPGAPVAIAAFAARLMAKARGRKRMVIAAGVGALIGIAAITWLFTRGAPEPTATNIALAQPAPLDTPLAAVQHEAGLGVSAEAAPTFARVGRGPCALRITAEPVGARIAIDGKLAGRAPLEVRGPCAARRIDVAAARYRDTMRIVTPSAERPAAVNIALARPQYTVFVKTFPNAAAVTVDGRSFGTTPTYIKVPAFTPVIVKIARPGFEVVEHQLTSQGPADRIILTLKRAKR